jgi:cytochrome c556
MQRLETGQQQKLMPWTAAPSEFRANADQLRHEAEIFAALGEVLTKEGMEDGDDDDYAGYSHQLRDAAREIVQAVERSDYDQARQAAGNIGKSCSDCHETYRG